MAAFCAVYRLIWLTALTLCNAANILISLCLTQPRPVQQTVQTVHCPGWVERRGIHPPSTATQQHRLGQRSVCSPACDWSVEIQSRDVIGCSQHSSQHCTGDTLLVSYPLAPQASAALLVLACFDILLNIFLLKTKTDPGPADSSEHACPSLLGKAKLFIFQ